MKKLLNKIPLVVMGIAGYSQIDALKKRVEDLEQKFLFMTIIFTISMVTLWTIIIFEISLLTS